MRMCVGNPFFFFFFLSKENYATHSPNLPRKEKKIFFFEYMNEFCDWE